MVSTIANGGVYLPPRVLMPGQVDGNGQWKRSSAAAAPQVTPMPFKPGGELPDPLPPGAHRVLSTMTAAQMRKMMEGVVLYGTGKRRSSTATPPAARPAPRKRSIRPPHLYSKTMHIASFAGIAPVNNPVIAVAVIIDSPKGDYYGATVSAPVFAEVAQQVLEYLAVPHDIDLRQHRALTKADLQVAEDDAHAQTADINALYAAANDLPSDDPLRGGSQTLCAPAASQPQSASPAGRSGHRKPALSLRTRLQTPLPAMLHRCLAAAQPPQNRSRQFTVIVASGKTLRVPSLIGLPVRKVIEQAAAAGLEVQITGSGTVREQAPAPGTMVAPGTKLWCAAGGERARLSAAINIGNQPSTIEPEMNWKELIAEVTAVGAGGDSAQPVTGVEYDSRKVQPGSVFVAMKGGSTDGNRYVEKAIAAGALGVITDSSQKFDHLLVFAPGLPVLEVEHGRRALAQASAAFFGHPERKLAATGITGTNGKTTTAFLIEALLNAAARKTVLIGTIEYHVAGEVRPSVHTTPESRDLFELMAEGVARGATELVTEVSSHALDQGRADGFEFRCGRLHQPHPRPPRLPRDHGEVFCRQAAALRRHGLSGSARRRDQRA